MSEPLPTLAFPPTDEPFVQPERQKVKPIGVINFLDIPLRMFGEPDRPLFVGKEVCRILGLKSYQKQLFSLRENEKSVFTISKLRYASREVILITEPGLYRLIFQSRKPQAEQFKTFVFEQVLPSLRKHGQFPPPGFKTVESLPLSVPGELLKWCPADAEFAALPVRDQIIVAERLEACAQIEGADHQSLHARCKAVAADKSGRRRGWQHLSVWRFHRRWHHSGRDWRALRTRYHLSGPRSRLQPVEAGR